LSRQPSLPDFHPLTIVRDWGNGQAFRIADALTGVAVFGATGSGKTSGVARHLALGYLANDFGGLVLCAKKEEREQWQRWAREAQREQDLIIVDAKGKWRFNFLDWEASRASEGGGLTINIVALLDEIAGAIAGDAGKSEGDENKFFTDALHHLNMNLVDLPLFAGLPVSLPLLRSIVTTAPASPKEISDPAWQQGTCAAIIREAEANLKTRNAPQPVMDDFEECRNYWIREYPSIGEKTRGIIALSFSMLARPFITRPLRQLFSTDTTVTPEDAFDGNIIVVDLPVQEFRLAGRVASLAWKYCFQVAVLRRAQMQGNAPLRPVFLWADEAQNFISDFDAEYQAVARSAGGCTVYLTQNRESYRRALGNDDSVDALLGNLQTKFFCQNSSVETNKWASDLLGERWVMVTSSNVSQGQAENSGSAGVGRSEQKRYFVEPSAFTTLKRGGAVYGGLVECIVYKGGNLFADGQPYKLLVFRQS